MRAEVPEGAHHPHRVVIAKSIRGMVVAQGPVDAASPGMLDKGEAVLPNLPQASAVAEGGKERLTPSQMGIGSGLPRTQINAVLQAVHAIEVAHHK